MASRLALYGGLRVILARDSARSMRSEDLPALLDVRNGGQGCARPQAPCLCTTAAVSKCREEDFR
jgi:hypothetical protein